MAKGIPDNVFALLEAADKQRGFPAGTMYSIMQQETGGKDAYIQDPTKYHYGLNAEGKRVAGHTGKISTAFGPFGILESTGKDPGYGVKPLQGKGIEEQIRFASDYLAARSKGAGSLQAGLSGYGEGDKYGKQVMARLGNKQAPASKAVPAQLAQAQAQPIPEAMPMPTPVQAQQEPLFAMADLQQAMPRPVQVADLAYGMPQMPVMNEANWNTSTPKPAVQNLQPNFKAFSSLVRRA